MTSMVLRPSFDPSKRSFHSATSWKLASMRVMVGCRPRSTQKYCGKVALEAIFQYVAGFPSTAYSKGKPGSKDEAPGKTGSLRENSQRSKKKGALGSVVLYTWGMPRVPMNGRL